MSARDEPTRVTPQLLQEWGLPDPGDSKKSRGTAMIIGGSSLSAGAVVLGGEAMLRVGAGKVAVTTDASVADVVRIAFPEAGVYESPGPGEPMTDDLRSACGWRATTSPASWSTPSPSVHCAMCRARIFRRP